MATIEMLDDVGNVTDECDAIVVDQSTFAVGIPCENSTPPQDSRFHSTPLAQTEDLPNHSTALVSWVSSAGYEYHLCTACVERDDYLRLFPGDE